MNQPGPALIIFTILIGIALALSYQFGRRAASAKGFAAPRPAHWFFNGMAMAGDHLSAAWLLGISGLIAFYGYDGFLYAIGIVAGWVVALFVLAEPMRRLGGQGLAGIMEARFHSRGVRLSWAIATLIVAIFCLIPEMVGAGALLKPLLRLPDLGTFGVFDVRFAVGVVAAGAFLMLIALVPGVMSSVWMPFIKGSLLVLICGMITVLMLAHGLTPKDPAAFPRRLGFNDFTNKILPQAKAEPTNKDVWRAGNEQFITMEMRDGSTSTWLIKGVSYALASELLECQAVYVAGGKTYIDGRPQSEQNELRAVNYVANLPAGVQPGAALGPQAFLSTLQIANVATVGRAGYTQKLADGSTRAVTIYYPNVQPGWDVLSPGGHPTLFSGIKSGDLKAQLNFLSLMLALFCGCAALPRGLFRYYAGQSQIAARRSAAIGTAAIGLFYMLTLFLGLGALTSAQLDPSDSNLAAPLLARVFGAFALALILAIAFTAMLAAASGLINAASQAVAHDLLQGFFTMNLDEHGKVRAGKFAAVGVGLVAIVLGILFKDMNVAFLLGWALAIAASANLPAIVMLLFWKGTTKQGITASILVGLFTSLGCILLSGDAYTSLWGIDVAKHPAIMPLSQPGLFTIPLAFLVLIGVSLMTKKKDAVPAAGTTADAGW